MRTRITAGVSALALVALMGAVACQRQTEAPAAPTKAGAVSKRGNQTLTGVSATGPGKSADQAKGQSRQLLFANGAITGEAKANETTSGQLTRSDATLADDGSYVDYHTFNGRRGDRVVITMESSDFDTYLMIGFGRRDALERLATDDDGGGGTNSRITITLPQDGQYTILANSYEPGATGNYTLRIETPGAGGGTNSGNNNGGGGAGPTAARTIAPNTPVQGTLRTTDETLDDGSYFHPWIFQGRAGEIVEVTMTSTDFDAFVLLAIGTPGSLDMIANDDDGGGGTNSRLRFTLPEDGVYTILANSYEVATGSYTLTMRTQPGVDYQTLYRGGGNPAERYALLVGIDDYPGSNQDLNSTVADARLMRETLINEFGYRPENIVMLLDEEANREHIINAFARHLGQAGPQGTALFYYSGHGTQMDENLGLSAPLDPENGDRKDEAIYVWGANERSSIILDDEIGYLVDSLRTDKVAVILDSCNSGTATRDGAPGTPKRVTMAQGDVNSGLPFLYVPRHFLGDYRAWADQAARGGTGFGFAEARRTHVLLAGATDTTLSYTASGWPDKGGVASVFTYFLVNELEAATPQTTFRDLLARVQQRTQTYSTQNRQDPVLVPQIGGELGTQRVVAFFRNN
jgi:hypothetical protein